MNPLWVALKWTIFWYAFWAGRVGKKPMVIGTATSTAVVLFLILKGV